MYQLLSLWTKNTNKASNYIAFLFLCNAYFAYPIFLPLEHPTLDFDCNAVSQQLVDQTYFTL